MLKMTHRVWKSFIVPCDGAMVDVSMAPEQEGKQEKQKSLGQFQNVACVQPKLTHNSRMLSLLLLSQKVE